MGFTPLTHCMNTAVPLILWSITSSTRLCAFCTYGFLLPVGSPFKIILHLAAAGLHTWAQIESLYFTHCRCVGSTSSGGSPDAIIGSCYWRAPPNVVTSDLGACMPCLVCWFIPSNRIAGRVAVNAVLAGADQAPAATQDILLCTHRIRFRCATDSSTTITPFAAATHAPFYLAGGH